MGGANGIAAHVLQNLNLTNERGLVHCSAQRTEVVVQTDALDLSGLAVQLETALLRYRNGADAEALCLLVNDLISVVEGDDQVIQGGRFGRP